MIEVSENFGFSVEQNESCQIKVAGDTASTLPAHTCTLGNFSGIGSDASAYVLALEPMPAQSYQELA